jgi:hypothetical protein
MAVSKTKAKTVKSDKKVDASIKKGMKKLEELQVKLGMTPAPELNPVESPKVLSTIEQVSKITEEYVAKIMDLYDSHPSDNRASLIERVHGMRERLVFYTSRFVMPHAIYGHDSEDLADIAGQLRALATVWDGDDQTKFLKNYDEVFHDLTDFIEA